jgi:hypothetical protein
MPERPETTATGTASVEARAHAREPVPRAGLTVRITNPDGSTTTLLSYPRDVSAGGVSFLCGTAPATGTPCTVQFATADGRRITVRGEVRWSREEDGGIHRIGVEFDRPLDERQLKAVLA